MSEDRETVEAFGLALESPLGAADIAGGWTEDARLSSADTIRRVIVDLDDGWGDHAENASHHLVRALDYWGVSRGRLAQAAAEAQVALIRLRGRDPERVRSL